MRTVFFFALNLRTAIMDWFAEWRERVERKRNIAEFREFCLKEAERHGKDLSTKKPEKSLRKTSKNFTSVQGRQAESRWLLSLKIVKH